MCKLRNNFCLPYFMGILTWVGLIFGHVLSRARTSSLHEIHARLKEEGTIKPTQKPN